MTSGTEGSIIYSRGGSVVLCGPTIGAISQKRIRIDRRCTNANVLRACCNITHPSVGAVDGNASLVWLDLSVRLSSIASTRRVK